MNIRVTGNTNAVKISNNLFQKGKPFVCIRTPPQSPFITKSLVFMFVCLQRLVVLNFLFLKFVFLQLVKTILEELSRTKGVRQNMLEVNLNGKRIIKYVCMYVIIIMKCSC